MVGRRLVWACALSLVGFGLFGCSSGREQLPAACSQGARAVEAALARAPGAVSLDGVPLSHCLNRRADGTDIQQVGSTFVTAAEDLADRARVDSQSSASVELGYMIAAVRKGAARTEGIHQELVRRLEQELTGVDTGSSAFVSGERAGSDSG